MVGVCARSALRLINVDDIQLIRSVRKVHSGIGLLPLVGIGHKVLEYQVDSMCRLSGRAANAVLCTVTQSMTAISCLSRRLSFPRSLYATLYTYSAHIPGLWAVRNRARESLGAPRGDQTAKSICMAGLCSSVSWHHSIRASGLPRASAIAAWTILRRSTCPRTGDEYQWRPRPVPLNALSIGEHALCHRHQTR